jgi:hypothetical protein
VISAALRDEAASLQNRWLLTSGSLLLALSGLVVSFTSSQNALGFKLAVSKLPFTLSDKTKREAMTSAGGATDSSPR